MKKSKDKHDVPEVDPTEDNPNPWVRHDDKHPFWKMAIPVEIMFRDGTRKILRTPQHYKGDEKNLLVKCWRVHRELEKMPYLYKMEWFRKFTFKDRLKIFFGKNLLVLIGIAMRNNVGNSQPVIIGYMSDKPTPQAHMEEQRKIAIGRHLQKGAKEI